MSPCGDLRAMFVLYAGQSQFFAGGPDLTCNFEGRRQGLTPRADTRARPPPYVVGKITMPAARNPASIAFLSDSETLKSA